MKEKLQIDWKLVLIKPTNISCLNTSLLVTLYYCTKYFAYKLIFLFKSDNLYGARSRYCIKKLA